VCIYMYACMHVCMYVCVFVSLCMCLCVYSYVSVHTCVCTIAHMCGNIHMSCVCVNYPSSLCMVACYSDYTHLYDLNSVTGDSNCTHCGPNTLAIQKSTHEMIRRSVLVRVVQTRRRFGPATTSFHASVHDSFSLIFLLNLILSVIY